MSQQFDRFLDYASRAQVVGPTASTQPKTGTPRRVRRPGPIPPMNFRRGSDVKRPVSANERDLIDAAVHAGRVKVCPTKYALSASPFWSPSDLR